MADSRDHVRLSQTHGLGISGSGINLAMLPLVRRFAFVLSMLAALAVSATSFVRADTMTPCPMTDQAGDIDGQRGLPMPCAAGVCAAIPFAVPSPASSAIGHPLQSGKRFSPIYAFAVTSEALAPPFHPPRV